MGCKVQRSLSPFSNNSRYSEAIFLGTETLEDNVGDFKVVKGSVVNWQLEPNGDISNAYFVSSDSATFNMDEAGGYHFSRRLMGDLEYFISLNSSENIANIDTVKYRVNILQDRFPSIYVLDKHATSTGVSLLSISEAEMAEFSKSLKAH